jgi:thymidylate synthase (FAD)
MSNDTVKVLDHGCVKLIETWGCDERIIEAARMSTNKGFQGWETDARLLAYLYANRHMTPFEMAGAVFEIEAPIFVFREWHRHRTQSYNELSARYTPLPDANYLPTLDRVKQSSGSNKQAQGVSALAGDDQLQLWLDRLQILYSSIEAHYQDGLAMGVPKELARLPIPVGRYSRMRASANLRNWLQFLDLRTAENAQLEIREYAKAIATELSHAFPRTLHLFTEGRKA